MYNISIGRFPEDSQAQGVVRPADDSWQLVIDKDGFPHLYLRVKLEEPGPGGVETGLFCIEDMLPDDCKVRDLMQSAFGGKLSPEEEDTAHQEYLADRARNPIPCPR